MQIRVLENTFVGTFAAWRATVPKLLRDMSSFIFCLLPKPKIIIKVNTWGQRSIGAKWCITHLTQYVNIKDTGILLQIISNNWNTDV